MMHNDSAAILDDLLSRYHAWAQSYRANFQAPSDPMFRNAKSARGWDTTAQIIEDELEGQTMAEVDFQISEMSDPYRTAIYVLARNCSSGQAIWTSPRLPKDPDECARIVRDARTQLTERLMRAGVL